MQPHYIGNKSNEIYFGAWHSGKKSFFLVYLKYCYIISDGNIVQIANCYAVSNTYYVLLIELKLVKAFCEWL